MIANIILGEEDVERYCDRAEKEALRRDMGFLLSSLRRVWGRVPVPEQLVPA